MDRFLRRLACVGLLTVILGSAPSRAGSFLGNSFGGVLYDVNTSTGAVTNPRGTGLDTLVGIASRSDGALFGLTSFQGTPVPNALYQIDPVSGASTLVGSTGLTNIFEGDLAFNPVNGSLFGIENVDSASNRSLFRIDVTTGVATIVGNISAPNGDLSAMAFDASGRLFVIDTGNAMLLNVDPTTAGINSSVSLSMQLGARGGMAFDPTTGTGYVADGGNGGTNSLYTIDISTGVLTLVGPTGIPSGLAGLTFSPLATTVIPEPPAGLLAAIASLFGGLACLLRTWRSATC